MHEPDLLSAIGRVVLAAALGGMVGLDRELTGQMAGLRTQVLVATGAALFTVAGLGFTGSDPTRVAAQVVTGIGFLGAGVILRQGGTVRGLTTAASLWVTAAIGLAAGLGRLALAAVTAAVAVLVLAALKWFVDDLFPQRRVRGMLLDVHADRSIAPVVDAVRGVLLSADVRRVQTLEDGTSRVTLNVRFHRDAELLQVADALRALDGVAGVDLRPV